MWWVVGSDGGMHHSGICCEKSGIPGPFRGATQEQSPVRPSSDLGERVVGSGPYHGSKHGWMMLLRAGVLQAQGKHAKYKRWREVEGGVEFLGDGEKLQVARGFVVARRSIASTEQGEECMKAEGKVDCHGCDCF